MIHTKPIKVKFGRIKNVLLAQCLDMDESLRGNLKYSLDSTVLISACTPQFWHDGQSLYLWGSNKEKDDQFMAYTYSTEEKAIEALRKFTKCIQEYNFENYDSPMDPLNPEIHWTTVG